MKIEEINQHEDGSVSYNVEMNNEETSDVISNSLQVGIARGCLLDSAEVRKHEVLLKTVEFISNSTSDIDKLCKVYTKLCELEEIIDAD